MNRTIVILLTAILCIMPFGCNQEKMDDQKEIAKVLENESDFSIRGDLEKLLNLYVQEKYNARLSITGEVSTCISGWEEVKKHQADLLQSDWMKWENKESWKEEMTIGIGKNRSAWAVCDNIWRWELNGKRYKFQNVQLTFLEKHKGNWKICFQAFIRDPEHPEVIEID